jgi:hypothetical protein
MQSSWKYFDLLIAVGALLIGLAVWFIPNFKDSQEMQDLYVAANERKARMEAREAEAARIAKEREELGIVYVPAPVEAPAQPAE